jgi:uncharacterized protein (TIGR02996 family)
MGIDEVFLQAIFDNPDDDAPRLIYADWLEERGDPRGEFIHVSCALEKLEATDPLRSELEVQREALLVQHEEEWFGRLKRLISAGTPPGGYVRYQRGFPDQIFVSAKTFLSHAGEVFRLAPVRHLALTDAGEHVRALATLEGLTRLASLNLFLNRIGDTGVQLLAASPRVNRLRVLNLSHNQVGDAGARALAGSPHLAHLTELYLYGNLIGDVGAQALAASPHLAELSVLNLEANHIDGRRKSARALRERFGDCLKM